MRGEELAVSRGESGPPVVKENLITVDPISGLLADDIEEGVLVVFEGKCGVEIWKEDLVARLSHRGPFSLVGRYSCKSFAT